MKYADIELLTKEIDSLYDKWCGSSTGLEVAEEGASIDTAESIFKEVRKIIGSLQQEQTEIDLEKEIEEHAIYMPHGEFASDNERLEDMEWAREEFRHFYELGFNARKL